MATETAFGGRQQYWAKAQSTFDTIEAFAATDAILPNMGAVKLEPELSYEEAKEAHGSADLVNEIKSSRGGKWNATFNLYPAAVGSAPVSIGPFLKAGLGTQTLTPATSAVYAYSSTATEGLQIASYITDNLYEVASGCVVEQWSLDVNGAATPTMTFSGPYARHGWAYETVVGTGGAAAEATVIPIDNACRGAIGVGAVIQIGDKTNSGTGYTVTAVDNTTGSANITITPALPSGGSGGVSAGDAIKPITPAHTLGTGTLITGGQNYLTIGGVEMGFISAKLGGPTGLMASDKEAGSDRISRLWRGPRRIEGELQVFFLHDLTAPLVGRAWDGATHAVSLRVGSNVAGRRMTIALPACRIEVTPWEMPDSDLVTATLKIKARQSAAEGDIATFTFN
jgi:hypothetical protein